MIKEYNSFFKDVSGGGVYTISCNKSCKVYIGSAKSFKDRFIKHIKDLNANRHINKKLQNSWNLHGLENFKFEELEKIELDPFLSNKDKKILLFADEQKYLDLLLKANHNDKYFTKFAYNTNRKAIGGGKVERAVSVFDLNMNFIEEFSSPLLASFKYGRHAGISLCCLGKLGKVGNFIFRYSDNIDIKFVKKKRKSGYTRKNTMVVYQYDLDGNFIKEWRSMSDANNSGLKGDIYKALNGINISASGFYWSYNKMEKFIPRDNMTGKYKRGKI